MTAKKRIGRGMVARLEGLEAKAEARREEVEALNMQDMRRAEVRLSPSERAAWLDAGRVIVEGEEVEALERMRRACAHLPSKPPLDHPAEGEAWAWMEALGKTPEGVRFPLPDPARVSDLCAYMEACARWSEAEMLRLPLSAEVHRCARWGAALWRFEAYLCQILGGKA